MAVLLELPRLLKLRRELIAVVAEDLPKSEPVLSDTYVTLCVRNDLLPMSSERTGDGWLRGRDSNPRQGG